MQRVDLSKPGEKKKVIIAAVLGLVAIIVLWWTLIGFDSSTPTTATRPTPSSAPQQRAAQSATQRANQPAPPTQEVTNLAAFTEIIYQPSSYNPPEARRNIFAYWTPPPQPVAVASEPTPTPPPPPPVLLASVSPANVYARTADFNLELAGDKFTPAMRIYIDGRELPTSYKSPQQLSTTVPAAVIATPGVRNVAVRTPDNQLFSNQLPINVAAAPTPDNFTYIGIISTQNRVGDIALVQERSNRNVINATRGDVLGGRFRVTSISEKELVMVDTSLKIKHTLKMIEGDTRGAGGPLSRPTPRVDAEDDEP